ncbi:MAG: peptide chain release factor N(5)-glutamine methyltransferase [Acholeplasmataceae bacterium]|jgi:release factor glutamine methyltransferase|nr:peptide chain release factor N(5)-glutamine methyltransferase [Acholeplasmataceae bacterium]MDD4824344.1 peptide chain release factor N(5)-glutamine methyltransferase [Acholeplasmataceae bacterium]
MTYKALLKQAEKDIDKANLEKDVAKFLIMHYADISVQELYLRLDQEVDVDLIEQFNQGLGLYINEKQPLQYITGKQAFYGHEFYVNEDVLIPRWETEELVERLIIYIDITFSDKKLDILDIGTGSGCIAVTLAKETSNSNVVATDISEKALKIAQKNNEKLETNVKFLVGDLFEPVKNMRFDLIVSNPPYIPNGEAIGPTVIHEPEVALYGGNKGLDFYERIIRESKNYINPHGLIAFEHAYNTKAELAELALKYYPNAKVTQFQDLSKRDRFTFIEVGEL